MKTTFKQRLRAIWEQLVYTFSSDASYYDTDTYGLIIRAGTKFALYAPNGRLVNVYTRRRDAVRRANKMGITV